MPLLSWVKKELLHQVGDSKYLEVLLTSAAIEERDIYICCGVENVMSCW